MTDLFVCKICGSAVKKIFDSVVLGQYEVNYYQCLDCQFIQTESPFWLEEAYQSAITDLDIGLIYRNIKFADILEKILLTNSIDPNRKFIDYGGGYGMFVRLMRDKGFDFYRQDIHCPNLFARYFDITDIKDQQNFELLTAFEVFEHLECPKQQLEIMLSFSDNILFSTEFLPDNNPRPDTWWYFAPETGQHISFFTLKSLQNLAENYKLHLYSNGSSIHMFTKNKLAIDPFEISKKQGRLQLFIAYFNPPKPILKKESLLMKDFEFIRSQINSK
jgi:hypothetical protein